MKKHSTSRTQEPSLLYMTWALSLQTPEDHVNIDDTQVHGASGADAYVYFAPNSALEPERWSNDDYHVNGRFLYARKPLSWIALEAARLVPATLRTRLDLALAYDQHTSRNVPMVWCQPSHTPHAEGGEIIAWYAREGLWGATCFSFREGRMGTTFTQIRAPLVEAALRHGYTPSPTLLERARKLPGMDAIRPVFISQGDPGREHTSLLATIMTHGIVGVTDQNPWLCLEGQPPEWLVSLLYEDRHMALSYVSAMEPTVEQVLGHALDVADSVARSPGQNEWTQTAGALAEALPYEVGLAQAHALHTLLGSAYDAFLAVHQCGSNSSGAELAVIEEKPSDTALSNEHSKQPGRLRYTQHAFFP